MRRRLLDAALGVFAESGFDNASVDQVAAAAGLTKGAVYSNFASKDDLFLAMMSDQILYRVEKVRTVLSVLPMEIQPRQTLRAIGGLLTEALIEQREWRLVFLDFWRRALRDDEVRAKFVAHRRALRSAIAENIEQVLERAPADSGMTVDEVVTLVLALSNGLAIEQYVAPESVSDGLFGRVLERLALS
ncbi:MAG: TetR/AcrR family transcriptional regulator [Acidimicrobiales bacterium]